MLVVILDPKTGQLLREHLRTARGCYRLRDEDRPKRTPDSTLRVLTRARGAGAHVGALSEHIHGTHGEVGVRRILGVLSRPAPWRPQRLPEASTRSRAARTESFFMAHPE